MTRKTYLYEILLGIALLAVRALLDTAAIAFANFLGSATVLLNVGLFIGGVALALRGFIGLIIGARAARKLSSVRIELPRATSSNFLVYIGCTVLALFGATAAIVMLVYIVGAAS